MSDIKHLFEPRSVAVIGASSSPDKIGYKIMDNIVGSGFKGGIYPINPKGGEILGRKVLSSVEQIGEDLDMAVIVIPASLTLAAVESCARKKVKYLVIITSGFSEMGNHELEDKIVKVAKESGMRILGPNIFGIYSAKGPINATFGQRDIEAGKVAIITQSGALGIAMMGKTKTANMGLSAMVSIGNKCDIDEADLLEYLKDSEETKVIMMYMEGVKNGSRLARVLKETTRIKPVIVIKSGKSKRGAMAAASHTGSLAGADEVFSDIMGQCGVIRAENVQEAFDCWKFFSNAHLRAGDNSVIITNGGGIGVMAADACEKYGVPLYDDIEVMKAAFSSVTPEFGSLKNPVDLTGQATKADYEKAMEAALADDRIHSVICLGCETAVLDADSLKLSIESIMHRTKKPFVFSFLGGTQFKELISYCRQKQIPIFSDVYEAVSCFGALYRHKKNTETLPCLADPDIRIDLAKVREMIGSARSHGRNFLLTFEAQAIMDAAGVPVPKTKISRSKEEAARMAAEIGFPVVMKVVSKDIIHKSDAGGVLLNIKSAEEVGPAYDRIIESCKKYKSDAVIEGIEIGEMLRPGVETIVGARHDKAFGPVVMFGMGGIYVEVMKDVAFRNFPLDTCEALEMISETKTGKLLEGVRGEKRKDFDAVVDMILKLGMLVKEVEEISDIEVNPLRVYDQGAKAVDVRILLK